MNKLFTIFFYLVLFKNINICAQKTDSLLINALLKDIAVTQVRTSGEFYKGMFPSFRECGGVPHNYQPDNNIFFTAITAFTLRNLLPYLTGDNKRMAEEIIAN